jgi:serine/threonine-protein kinase
VTDTPRHRPDNGHIASEEPPSPSGRRRSGFRQKMPAPPEAPRASEDRGRLAGTRAGRWLLIDRLGRGGMGEVYRSHDSTTGMEAAVKVLRAPADSVMAERLEREAESLLRLRSPHVVALHEVGRLPDRSPFIAMERLHGRSLDALLRSEERLDLVAVARLCDHAARALDAASSMGIVHRDVKPSNLFLCDGEGGGTWKVLDFGVARSTGQSAITGSFFIGTPGYVSPEQACGLPTDARSDLFSLGAVLYRALTGRPPFAAPDLADTLDNVVRRRPIRPTVLCPDLPADLDDALAVALAKSADDRYADAAELAWAFDRATGNALPADVRARGARLRGWTSPLA